MRIYYYYYYYLWGKYRYIVRANNASKLTLYIFESIFLQFIPYAPEHLDFNSVVAFVSEIQSNFVLSYIGKRLKFPPRENVKCPSRESAGGRIYYIRSWLITPPIHYISAAPCYSLYNNMCFFCVTKTTFCLLLLFDGPNKPQQLDNTRTYVGRRSSLGAYNTI